MFRNILSNNSWIGIWIFQPLYDSIIYGNTISDSETGLDISHSVNNLIQKNIFLENNKGIEMSESRKNNISRILKSL